MDKLKKRKFSKFIKLPSVYKKINLHVLQLRNKVCFETAILKQDSNNRWD